MKDVKAGKRVLLKDRVAEHLIRKNNYMFTLHL